MNLKMWNKWKDFRLDEDLNEDGHTDVPSKPRNKFKEKYKLL